MKHIDVSTESQEIRKPMRRVCPARDALDGSCNHSLCCHFWAGIEWSSGDKWSVEVRLEPGQYDFKAVVMRQDGSIAEWEGGENRTIEVQMTQTPYSSIQFHVVACPPHSQKSLAVTGSDLVF